MLFFAASDFEVGECWGYNRFFRLDLLVGSSVKSSFCPAFLKFKKKSLGLKKRPVIFVCEFSYWLVCLCLFVTTMVSHRCSFILWMNDAVLFLLCREVKAI